MTLTGLFLFAAAVFVTAAPPGAIVTAIVTRVLSNGWRDALLLASAIWLGDAIWLCVALLGLTAVSDANEWVFIALKVVGVIYLLWLAWKMWHRDLALETGTTSGQKLATFAGGLTLALASPEIIVFYLAIVPNVIDLANVGIIDWLVLTATLLATLALVDGAYMALADRLRSLILHRPDILRRINRAGAVIMLLVAGYVALA